MSGTKNGIVVGAGMTGNSTGQTVAQNGYSTKIRGSHQGKLETAKKLNAVEIVNAKSQSSRDY